MDLVPSSTPDQGKQRPSNGKYLDSHKTYCGRIGDGVSFLHLCRSWRMPGCPHLCTWSRWFRGAWIGKDSYLYSS